MTCPKCRSHNVKPIERWNISGHELTVPLLHLWKCRNQDCRHQWPRLNLAQRPTRLRRILGFTSPVRPTQGVWSEHG